MEEQNIDFEDTWAGLNSSERVELDCLVSQSAFSAAAAATVAADALMCGPDFDRINCWPPTAAGSIAVIPCMQELNGVTYDTRDTAWRLCQSNGTWSNYSNYTLCKVVEMVTVESAPHANYSFFIYLCGYSLSLIALFIACSAFFYFKEIHCVRNKIHANLFITYILSNFCWILSATIQATEKDGDTNLFWCTLSLLLRFFHLSSFFWMFVEGLYLFVQVIAAFSVDNTCIKLRHYVFIGWGLPFVIVIIWASLAANLSLNTTAAAAGAGVTDHVDGLADLMEVINATDLISASSPSPSVTIRRHPKSSRSVMGQKVAAFNRPSDILFSDGSSSCPFIATNDLEYIYIIPIFFVLGLNTFFLVWIMWVVITKLRSHTHAANSEANDHQNWKAAKALLVIIPLLGITYVCTITGPTDKDSISFFIFEHVRAFLLSIQGFAVTLPYCFLNTEIRNVVRCHWQRYQTTRYAMDNTQQTRVAGGSARNSLSVYHNYNSEGGAQLHSTKASQSFRLQFSRTPQHRPPLVHQQSLPTNLPSSNECSFTTENGNKAVVSNGGGDKTNGGNGNSSSKRFIVDRHSTIEEASDELPSNAGLGTNDDPLQTVALLESHQE